jgi:hypothetical protein
VAVFLFQIRPGKEDKAMQRKTTTQAIPPEDVRVKEFLDMIAPSIIKFNTDHFICGNTYRCVWALREYPNSLI